MDKTILNHFNSRPSARGDFSAVVYWYDLSISIHAPPRGATQEEAKRCYMANNFNSRPSARGDHTATVIGGITALFQFTPLREGRQNCESGDCKNHVISIHAPPRGATLLHHVALIRLRLISIHAPPRGATAAALVFPSSPIYFNSRPSARGDAAVISSALPLCNFNSRPSARGDSKRYAISANLLFNPYKSAWLNNNATQFVEIILVIFHRIIA